MRMYGRCERLRCSQSSVTRLATSAKVDVAIPPWYVRLPSLSWVSLRIGWVCPHKCHYSVVALCGGWRPHELAFGCGSCVRTPRAPCHSHHRLPRSAQSCACACAFVASHHTVATALCTSRCSVSRPLSLCDSAPLLLWGSARRPPCGVRPFPAWIESRRTSIQPRELL